MKRASAKEPTLINQVAYQETEDANENELVGDPEEDTPDSSEETAEVEVNKTVSKTRQEAHPGNIRHVLSGIPKKKQTTQMKLAQWSDDMEWYNTSKSEGDLDKLLGDYDWDPDDEQDFH